MVHHQVPGQQLKPGEKLRILQGMGTTFIKLGQFLATRPDIIGDEMAKSLEKLQDKVPAFDLYEAKKIIKQEIGDKNFKDLIEISRTYSCSLYSSSSLSKDKS